MSERSLGSLVTGPFHEQIKLIIRNYAGISKNKRYSDPGKESRPC